MTFDFINDFAIGATNLQRVSPLRVICKYQAAITCQAPCTFLQKQTDDNDITSYGAILKLDLEKTNFTRPSGGGHREQILCRARTLRQSTKSNIDH